MKRIILLLLLVLASLNGICQAPIRTYRLTQDTSKYNLIDRLPTHPLSGFKNSWWQRGWWVTDSLQHYRVITTRDSLLLKGGDVYKDSINTFTNRNIILNNVDSVNTWYSLSIDNYINKAEELKGINIANTSTDSIVSFYGIAILSGLNKAETATGLTNYMGLTGNVGDIAGNRNLMYGKYAALLKGSYNEMVFDSAGQAEGQSNYLFMARGGSVIGTNNAIEITDSVDGVAGFYSSVQATKAAESYGLYIAAPKSGANIGRQVGVFMEDQIPAHGDSAFSIYAAGGNAYFRDTMDVGALKIKGALINPSGGGGDVYKDSANYFTNTNTFTKYLDSVDLWNIVSVHGGINKAQQLVGISVGNTSNDSINSFYGISNAHEFNQTTTAIGINNDFRLTGNAGDISGYKNLIYGKYADILRGYYNEIVMDSVGSGTLNHNYLFAGKASNLTGTNNTLTVTGTAGSVAGYTADLQIANADEVIGLYVATPADGATITSQFGILLENQIPAHGDSAFSIYSRGGNAYFRDTVDMGALKIKGVLVDSLGGVAMYKDLNTAVQWDSTATYQDGDFVWYYDTEGTNYLLCKTAHSPSGGNPFLDYSKWILISYITNPVYDFNDAGTDTTNWDSNDENGATMKAVFQFVKANTLMPEDTLLTIATKYDLDNYGANVYLDSANMFSNSQYIIASTSDNAALHTTNYVSSGDINIGLQSDVYGSNTAIPYGIRNYVALKNNSAGYGIYNNLGKRGSSDNHFEPTGIYNNINGNTLDNAVGLYNRIDGYSVNGSSIISWTTSNYANNFTSIDNTISFDTGTGNIIGYNSQVHTDTTDFLYGFRSLISGNKIGTAYNIFISSPSGSIANNYGIYLNDQKVNSTKAYSIYSDGGNAFFKDTVSAKRIRSDGQLMTIIRDTAISISADSILVLYSQGQKLINAPGSGKAIEVLSCSYKWTYIADAYDAKADAIYIGNELGDINTAQFSIGVPYAAQINLTQRSVPYSDATDVMKDNHAVILSTTTDNPANGTSTLKLYLTYRIITL